MFSTLGSYECILYTNIFFIYQYHSLCVYIYICFFSLFIFQYIYIYICTAMFLLQNSSSITQSSVFSGRTNASQPSRPGTSECPGRLPLWDVETLLGGSSHLVVKNHGDRKSPKPWVVGPLPNGRTSWLINGGDPFTTYKSWDDPPSGGFGRIPLP